MNTARTYRMMIPSLTLTFIIGCSENSPSGPDAPAAPAAPAGPAVPVDPVTQQEIAYQSGVTISVINADGSGTAVLAEGSSPAWSPDGRTLAFSNTKCETDWYAYYECVSGGILTMNSETRAITILPGGEYGVEPDWSPAGDRIVFVRSDRRSRLLVSRLDDGKPPLELTFAGVGEITEPSWSPDGSQIAFGCNSFGSVCVVNSDGTGLMQRLSPDGTFAGSPSWSPDGSKIAFQFLEGRPATSVIAVMARDGTGITRLTDGYSPAWSRDGKQLVFSRNTGLFISNADGSDVRRLTNGNDRSPTWRPR